MAAPQKQLGGPAETALRHPLRSFRAAVGFLTILPVGSPGRDDGPYFSAALFYFPLVGLLLGSLSVIVFLGLQAVFPMLLNGVLLAVLLSLWSGFIHLDGLADSADGFLSGRPREACLDIMRDSRVGVMGSVAIGALLLIKAATLATIDPATIGASLVIAAVAGRCSIVWMMALLPYARSGSGLGRLFYSDATRLAAVWAGLVLCGAAFVLQSGRGFVLLGCCLLTALLLAGICRRKIGGATGDTLGAACEVMETVVLLVCVAGF